MSPEALSEVVALCAAQDPDFFDMLADAIDEYVANQADHVDHLGEGARTLDVARKHLRLAEVLENAIAAQRVRDL